MLCSNFSINCASVLRLKFTLTNFRSYNKWWFIEASPEYIVLLFSNIQHIPYKSRVSAELYIRDLHKPCTGPFPVHIVQIFENSSDVSRWAFHATQNERSAPRFVPRHVSLWIFGHRRRTSVFVGVLSLAFTEQLSFLSLIFFNESKVFVRALSRRANYRNRRVPLHCPTNWRPLKLFHGNL